jgi:hypothetical protein
VVHDQVRDRERIRSFHLQASIDLIGSYVTSDFTSVPAAVAVVPYHRPPSAARQPLPAAVCLTSARRIPAN